MPKRYQGYWTPERVKNGLQRFARDYFAGNEENLPPRPHNYRHAVPKDQLRWVQKMRLYPPFQVILRHYKSLPDAWKDLGFEVKETSLEYWTRDEVINGLKRFHEDFGFCAPSNQIYMEKAQFSDKFNKRGQLKANGAYGKYPSYACIFKFFRSMKEAWGAAGFDVEQGWEPWSPIEDWFILESVGIMPRTEVAELIKRTVPAIKRRLYDLGRNNSRNRWGISISRAAALMGIGGNVLSKYLDYGMVPYFRGNKVIYLNPADLTKVREVDWSKPIGNELDILIKKALIQRLNKILIYREDWRKHEIYRFQKTKEYLARRLKNPRKSAFAEELPAPPNNLKTGDWVRITHRIKQVTPDRLGVIKHVFYSPQKQPRADGTKRCAWIANVEFPKIKRFTPDGENRVRYNLPLDVLILSEKPDVEPKPLKMNDEAIRSRHRRSQYTHRAGNRFEEIKGQLT